MNNEERRRKFFEDDQTNESFASKIKHKEWIEDIEKEVNKLHSATPLEQQPSINNYQLSNT